MACANPFWRMGHGLMVTVFDTAVGGGVTYETKGYAVRYLHLELETIRA